MILSVVIPVYNAAEFLPRCLESVLQGIPKDSEVLLIDDGSTDDSARIAKSFSKLDSRVRLITKPNGGVSSARNRGLEIARGEFISFVDSDDWIIPAMYAELIATAQMGAVDIVKGAFARTTENDRDSFTGVDFERLSNKVSKSPNEIARKIAMGEIPGYCYVYLFKKSVLEDLHFDETLPFMEDAIFTIAALLNANSLIDVDDIFYCYFQNPDGASKNPLRIAANIKSAAQAAYRIGGLFSSSSIHSSGFSGAVESRRIDLLGRQIISAIQLGHLNRIEFDELANELVVDEYFMELAKKIPNPQKLHPSVFVVSLIRNEKISFAWNISRILGKILDLRSVRKRS